MSGTAPSSPVRLRERIVGVLSRSGPLSIQQLHAEVGGHPVAVRRKCRRLSEDGVVRMPQSGVYELADEAR